MQTMSKSAFDSAGIGTEPAFSSKPPHYSPKKKAARRRPWSIADVGTGPVARAG
jgi:hypothetical protein